MRREGAGKRFELTGGEEEKRFLHAARETLEKMREEYPEVVGLTLHGSIVKGEFREGYSDIDGFLWIDEKAAHSAHWYEEKFQLSLRAILGIDVFKAYRVKHIEGKVIGEQYIAEHLARIQGESLDDPSDATIHFLYQMARLFHLAVGRDRGLGKYRRQLIEGLQALGEKGERVWTEYIGSHLERQELGEREIDGGRSYVQNKGDLKYPRTLAEAKEMYCK